MIRKCHIFFLLPMFFLMTPFLRADVESFSLDGEWEIIFDHENRGKDGKWHLDKEFSSQKAKKITVPTY